ncbi:MAG: excinuclease ABC subunit UvrB [Patescibacteria group bacterium]
MEKKFQLISKNKPSGDQPKAIKQLVEGLRRGYDHQTLLGVTGSGKTFTIANVIQAVQKPTLVIAHNKTLAAQLTNEFRELFPKNSVHYFVSYYDYYQPEAYMPVTDTYIGKEAMINDEIDKLRHAATTALLTRRDVIVVASVSCIYGLGAPEVYAENIFHLKVGDELKRAEFSRKLISLQFNRTNSDLKRGTFRLRGENWEIMPPDREVIYTIELEAGKISVIYEVDPVRGFVPGHTPKVFDIFIAPAKHFITLVPERKRAIKAIREELKERLDYFEKNGKYLEAERLERRTKFDIAMIDEIGYCHGIENYSRHLSGRSAGEPPETLLDYFSQRRGSTQINAGRISMNRYRNQHESASRAKPDFLTIIDESHVTVPQINGMYEGDASRKRTLIEYGFRLPSAADNRPLKFSEFESRIGQVIYTSATPGPYELKNSGVRVSSRGVRVSPRLVEQVIRPTGLVDPKIIIRPARGQVDNLVREIEERLANSKKNKGRVLVTTLTKKMAEDLADYLGSREIRDGERSRTTTKKTSTPRPAQGEGKQPIKVAYLHSDVKTLDRIRILTSLRKGDFDVLVGVNLLREGLDLPEVSLVAILDADKEGFLRSETSLIQTIGRAARNLYGEVLIYADNITGSIKRAVDETERRRMLQLEYNKKHGITPKTIVKKISDITPIKEVINLEMKPIPKSKKAREQVIKQKEKEMRDAASRLDFELAAILRDELRVLRKKTKI